MFASERTLKLYNEPIATVVAPITNIAVRRWLNTGGGIETIWRTGETIKSAGTRNAAADAAAEAAASR